MFTLRDEDSVEDAIEGRRARPSDHWLVPINPLVEHDLVWGGYIAPSIRGKLYPEVGIDEIERGVSYFHFEWMNSPPKTFSFNYRAQASLK